MGLKRSFSRDVKEQVCEAQHWVCKICGNARIQSYHHRLQDTVTNLKLFPLFIDSPFNCAGLCNACHDSDKIYTLTKITMEEAAVYEHYLKGIK